MSKLNVLYQFDENYAAFAGVSITTLFERNKDIDELTVYLAAKDVSSDNCSKLEMLSKQYGRKLVYLPVDHIYQKLADLGVYTWNGSLAIWMKMFVIDLIPDSVDQLLYIDSDTLITSSLLDLAQMNLGDSLVGAVIDSITTKSNERLSLGDRPYFNSGIMYFNVKAWRAQNTQTEMLRHLEKHVKEYVVPDQDLLNDFFREKILCLSPKYNFQGIHFIYRDENYFPVIKWKKDRYYSPETIAESRRSTAIIHFFRFCGQYPWQPGNIHPCKEVFDRALAASLWKDFCYPPKPLKNIYHFERILYKILPQKLFLKLHLKVSN